MRHGYYYKLVEKCLSFIIPPGKKVLFYGSMDGRLLSALSPEKGVGIEEDETFSPSHGGVHPRVTFHSTGYRDFDTDEKFDYIVLFCTLGKTDDISAFLAKVRDFCHPTTRVIVYQNNYLWQWALSLAETLSLKRKESIQNWLSISDIRTYLEGAGFEVTRVFRKTAMPLSLFGIGRFVNLIFVLLPIFDFLKLDQYLLSRPRPDLFPPEDQPKSLTICLTVRDEKENIESIVQSLPEVCEEQELLFVEGHSTDGTKEEVERMMGLYPEKNIRLMGQPGKGQGDAIRVGFKEARGDIVILYEGDGTSSPEDLLYFYDAMKSGRFEFIEGSRFVYPIDSKAMPVANNIGNILFAKWFSFFLGQRITDVLGGIKAILKRDYDALYERWGFLGINDPFGDFELLFGSARMGLRIGELPMHYRPRSYGESKSSVIKHGFYLAWMAIKGYFKFRK